MIKAILLDFDGTIVDTTEAVYNTYKNVAENRGLDFPSFEEFVSIAVGHRDFEVMAGLRSLPEREWLDVYSRFTHLEQLFGDSLEFLNKLKHDGFKVGVATSASWERINNMTKKFGLEGFFDSIVTTMDGLKPKPDPNCLVVLAKKLGVKNEECIYIGDAASDMLAAKAAGMLSIGLRRGIRKKNYFDETEPDAVFDKLIESYKFIKAKK